MTFYRNVMFTVPIILVILVKWNEPYQKLASCDSSGIIFVWIKYEGRWSIELINDRNTPVTHFSWSHDGRMALICYQDGFVLVGSVAGQRYWSSMLNLESTITCGIWTPDDQQVYFGTTQGQIIVMDVHGAMVSQVQLCSDIGITSMAWSCEKFKMEEGEDTEPGVSNASKRSFVLAVSFRNGSIYLLKSFDDVSPSYISTGLNGSLGFVMEWSNSRELLAVAGTCQESSKLSDAQNTTTSYKNLLNFYTESGMLLYTTQIPSSTSTVSAITWGHNDKRLFIATGTQVHIAWVSRRVASLQLLCRLQIQCSIGTELFIPRLPLPSRIKNLIGHLFAQTIRCCVPNAKSLREFVSRPPACSTRLHCTMIRHDDENNLSSGTCYTLYLEYLGGLVPLLKGKRTSKIRPEFVIFDPQTDELGVFLPYSESVTTKSSSASSHSTMNGRTDSSESEMDDGCKGSPKLIRKRKQERKRKGLSNGEKTTTQDNEVSDELAYVDTLPEEVKLVEVNSNIWGTKFKIHGLAKNVPANLGQISYKTSLLHLQPRQMTVVVTELRDDSPGGPDPTFNPNIFSEDEDDVTISQKRLNDVVTTIAPMSPRPSKFIPRVRSNLPPRSLEKPSVLGPLAKAESYEDDFPYVEFAEVQHHTPIARPKNIETSSPRPGPSYTSLVTQYSRSSSNSSGQSRHAISPLCCEGSVPTLQSPKNAVAPSDIIFDRPPAAQTTVMSYSNSIDYANNVFQVKGSVMSDITKTGTHSNQVPFNLSLNFDRMEVKMNKDKPQIKKKEIQYIDEETPTTSTNPSIESKMRRTPTVISISPACLAESITRSCSVGYLDTVEMVPSDIALSMLRKDAPNKRLVLVDRKPRKNKKMNEDMRKQKLQQCGKSKSLDSCDILQDFQKHLNDGDKAMPKLHETSETDSSSDSVEPNTSTEKNQQKVNQTKIDKSNDIEKYVQSKTNGNDIEKMSSCSKCKQLSCVCRKQTASKSSKQLPSSLLDSRNNNATVLPGKSNKTSRFEQSLTGATNRPNISKANTKNERVTRKKSEVITSYTDSPLFSRRHRFGDDADGSRFLSSETPVLGRKNDNSFSFIKQLSEARRRRKEDSVHLLKTEIEVEHVESEQKSSVSLHTQALTTLENIISRLRDLDENRYTPPSSPKPHRQPRSSPASPAPSKKGKRHQSASPIRHILNSPLLNRRQRKKPQPDSSDEESNLLENEEKPINSKQYRDLETFQKAQLRQKLKRGKIEPNGTPTVSHPAPLRREFVMHNKAPMWNENSQVYQLDFGGRVTQESAKNFQIEFRGKQVMQFGRIDGNAYTLDFQYPFSALQAFSVALANVTQRLK
ncbi:Tubby-related protein 4 [Pseudolycoriella hygida]|uniref:Tubby-related protein 4 n=1 Tax=Pseudolycoriella hygida TaxID=35572 RepID=A0A9Q0MWU4_9DIPT|nr:Tubby-related protein 4 [Pseudolycoriella hygida]